MSDDTPYQNVRDADLLGPFIGAKVVEITQQDAEEFEETQQSYVALHFDNGSTLRFPIGDDGFDILDVDADG